MSFIGSKRRTIVAGLGNPGKRYDRDRHNVGFMVLDRMAEENGCSWQSVREKADICSIRVAGWDVVLVKPQTFMNLSGNAVGPLVKRRNVDPTDIIVIHDDLDLVPGTVRVKRGGGDGGHRGVRSIASVLGTKDFLRVRLGIGRPPDGVSPKEYVLFSYRPNEAAELETMLDRAQSAVHLLLAEGLDRAQNVVHAYGSRVALIG